MRTVPATRPSRLRGLGFRIFIALEWVGLAALAAWQFVGWIR